MKNRWQTKIFEELIEDNLIGLTKNSREQSEDKAWPYVKMNNITRNNTFDFSNFTCVDATEEELSKFTLRDGDFLFNTRNSHELVGKSCIYESNSNNAVLFNNNIMRIRFKCGVDARFVLLAFSSKPVSDELNSLKSGTTNVSAIYFKDLRSLVIPIPPLAEQQRIVGLLDEAFEGLANAKANAEKNLQNARALFESHLQSVFTQRGPGWIDKTFEELIESNIIGLTKNSREQGEDKAWPYVKMNNITRYNRFDFSSFTCVDATPEEVSKFSLKDGDFLFNTRNSHELVGKSCIYESDSNDAVLYNNNIMRVRFQRGIDPRFVLLAFSSKGVADELNALKSGTTNVSAIYFKDLKSLVIPVPSIAEQKKIAAKLEALSEETQRLARIYERKLAALESLKKSLLHQAFTGEL